MDKKVCYICSKEGLNMNEIGLTKKLLGRKITVLYCIDCLASQLEVDVDFLIEKVEEFKAQGCELF